MARYFFHIQDGTDIPDEEGVELPDDAAAKTIAIVTAGAIIGESAKLWDGGEWKMVIVDEHGHRLAELKFSLNA